MLYRTLSSECANEFVYDVVVQVEYLDSLGKTRIQEVKSQAAIGKAVAEKDADIAIAQCVTVLI